MEVILYHSSTCPQCKMVERMMKDKKINYVSCMDVDQMLARGIRHTPSLAVGDKVLQGKELFDWIKEQA